MELQRAVERCSAPHTWPHVLQCEVLVRKAAPIDGLASCAIVVGEVASLYTEYLVIGYQTAGRGTVGPLRREPSNPLKVNPKAKGPTVIQ